MNDLPETIDQLAARLETLERRVYALEHPGEASTAAPAPKALASPQAREGETLGLAQTSGAFTILGKALLGIAGAYLLRAIEESAALPKLGVASVAVAYAMLWLVLATRVRAGAWFASTIFACTSAVILAPMLWELTLTFKVLPAMAAASILGAFVLAATALEWKRNLGPVLWIANSTAILVAMVLGIATHDLVPFGAVLIFMVLLGAYADGRGMGHNIQFLAATAADLALWVQIFIYASPQNTRPDYPPLGVAELLVPSLLLFLIGAGSVGVKTVRLHRSITAFETIQTTIAFLLAATSLLYFEPGNGALSLGIACLVLSAANYAADFALFDRTVERRNYNVFAAWSAALLLAGSLLCLPLAVQAVCLGTASVAATWIGVRLNRLTLNFHGLAFLLAAAVTSSLFAYSFQSFVGPLPGALAGGMLFVTACAALCYAVSRPCRGENWARQLLHLAFASTMIVAITGLVVQGLVWLIGFRIQPSAHHLAFVRTLTMCGVALALGFCGTHWRRMELTRISYAALLLVVAKLLFEDLRHGHLGFIAASISLVAATLIAVPRISRMGQRNEDAASAAGKRVETGVV